MKNLGKAMKLSLANLKNKKWLSQCHWRLGAADCMLIAIKVPTDIEYA